MVPRDLEKTMEGARIRSDPISYRYLSNSDTHVAEVDGTA